MIASPRHLAPLALLAAGLLAGPAASVRADDGAARDPTRLIEAGCCREAVGLLEAKADARTVGSVSWSLLGRAYLGMGRYAEAEAIVAQPGPPVFEPARLVALAQIAEVHGDLDRALAVMTEAVEARRRSLPSVESLDGASALAEARTLLGALAFRAGRLDAAKDQFQRAISAVSEAHARLHAQDIPHDERDPRLLAGGATAGLARVYAALGDAARAERSWRGIMARTDDPEILADLVAYSLSRGDSKAASRHRDRALRLSDGKPAHRITRALLLAQQRESLAEAVALAEAAHRDGPNVPTTDALAWILHLRGDDNRAAATLQPVLDLGSRDPMVLYHAGAIARSGGRSDDARRLLKQCLAINPHFDPIASRDAREILAQLP